MKLSVFTLVLGLVAQSGLMANTFNDAYFSQKEINENLQIIDEAKIQLKDEDYMDAKFKLYSIRSNTTLLKDSPLKQELRNSLDSVLSKLDDLQRSQWSRGYRDRDRQRDLDRDVYLVLQNLHDIEMVIIALNDLDGALEMSRQIPGLVRQNKSWDLYQLLQDLESILEAYSNDRYLSDALEDVEEFDDQVRFKRETTYRDERAAEDLIWSLERKIKDSRSYNRRDEDDCDREWEAGNRDRRHARDFNSECNDRRRDDRRDDNQGRGGYGRGDRREPQGQIGRDSDFAYRKQTSLGKTDLYSMKNYETKRIYVNSGGSPALGKPERPATPGRSEESGRGNSRNGNSDKQGGRGDRPNQQKSSFVGLRVKAVDDSLSIDSITVNFDSGQSLTLSSIQLAENQSIVFDLKSSNQSIKSIDVRAVSSAFLFGTKARAEVFGMLD